MNEEELSEPQIVELHQDLLARKRRFDQAGSEDEHRTRIQAHQAQGALNRVKSGDYGYCLKCYESIGYALLKETPERRFCRVCAK